jgi:hypothetical protein
MEEYPTKQNTVAMVPFKTLECKHFPIVQFLLQSQIHVST